MKSKYYPARIGSILVLLMVLCIGKVYAQVTVTASAGTASASYTNLSSAFTAINAGTHQGAIVIDLNGSFTDAAISVLNSSGAGSASYSSVLVRPSTDGVVMSYASATGRGVIELNGADNVTINGDNPNTGGTNRNLTIQNTAVNTTTFTSCIRVATSTLVTTADNISIQNLNLLGSATGRNVSTATSTTGSEGNTFGVVVMPGASTTSATTAPSAITSLTTTMASGQTANNLTISNNAFDAAAKGIYVAGSTTTNINVLTISNNLIGNASAASTTTIYNQGIGISGCASGTVSGNTVQNINGWVGTSTVSLSISGIYLGDAASVGTNLLVERNLVSHVYNQNTGTWPAAGIVISLSSASNSTIQNNFISDINRNQSGGTGFSLALNVGGIKVVAGTNYNIYHNTVNLFGAYLGTNATGMATCAFALGATSNTNVDCRNNIFSNTMTGGSTSNAHVAILLPSGGTSAMNLTLNNNAYYCASGTNQFMAHVGTSYSSTGTYTAANFNAGATSPSTNFRAYTSTLSAAGTNDNASLGSTLAAPIMSSSNLHLNNASAQINDVAMTGASLGVGNDFDGDARSAPQTIGGDEASKSPCSGTPAPGNTLASVTSFACPGGSTLLSLQNTTLGLGITYQWESSTDGDDWAPIAGATNSTYSATVPSEIFYHCVVTCSGSDGTSNPVFITLTGPSAGTAKGWSPVTVTGFTDDVIANGVGLPTTSATNTADLSSPAQYFVEATYQQTAGSALQPFALPTNGVIRSNATPGLSYQMQSASGNNSLRLTGTGSGTLTLATPQSAPALSLLVAAGNGPTTVNVTVTFSDATTEVFNGQSVLDWFNAATTYSVKGIGRVDATGVVGGTGVSTGDNPRLWDMVLNLSPTNYSKLISSITVAKTVTGGVTHVLGVALASSTQGTVCQEALITLKSYGASTGAGIAYQWQQSTAVGGPYANVTGGTGATSVNYITAGLANGTMYYKMIATCTSGGLSNASNAVTVVADPAPIASFTTNSPVCAEGVLNLTGSTVNGTSFKWTGPNSFTSTLQNPSISNLTTAASGNYTLTTTFGNCTSIATNAVTVGTPPTVITASASPNPPCVGSDFYLSATGGAVSGYSMNAAGTETFIDISSTGTNISGTFADDGEYNVTIPSFNFNGVNYTNARVGLNGAIVFVASSAATGDVTVTNAALPSTSNSAGNIFLAPYWDDLDVNMAGTVKSQTIGSKYILQWNAIDHNLFTTGTITFQVQLDLATGKIHFIYPDVVFGDPTYNNGAAATIGIQYSSTSALQYSFNTASLTNGQCITFTPNSADFTWSGPNSFTGSGALDTVSTITSAAAGTYTVVATNSANGCTRSATADVTVISKLPKKPAKPVADNTDKVCPGNTHTYTTIPGDTITTGYFWTVPTGAVITSGQGTAVINVTYNAGFVADGSVTVIAMNSCGSSAAQVLPVKIGTAPSAPAISGPTVAGCSMTGVVYSITTPIAGVTYTWAWTTGTNATIASGQGTSSIHANFTFGYSSDVLTVTGTNGCGTGLPKSLTVKNGPNPAVPDAITGDIISGCGLTNVLYSVATPVGGTYYTWAWDSLGQIGAVIASGQGTSTAHVNYNTAFTKGSISVTAKDACGFSGPRKLSVKKGPVPTTGPVTGENWGVCSQQGLAYSSSAVSFTGAPTYLWAVDTTTTGAIATGQGTANVTVNYAAGFSGIGSVMVTAMDGCGSGKTVKYTIWAKPIKPDVPSGAAVVCAGSSHTYSTSPVYGATDYTWTAPALSTITAGAVTSPSNTITTTSTTVTVHFGAKPGKVSVKANAPCGSGGSGSLVVDTSCAPAKPSIQVGGTSALTVDLVPNPATDQVTIRVNATEEGTATVRLLSLTGQQMAVEHLQSVQHGQVTIPLNNLAAGLYMVEVTTNGQKITKQLVKQ